MNRNADKGRSGRKASYRSGLVLAVSGLLAAAAPLHAVAHTAIGGGGSVANVIITDNVLWTTLRSEVVNFTGDGNNHNCAVTASAHLNNPTTPGTRHTYAFTLAADNQAPAENIPQTRYIDFTNNPSPGVTSRHMDISTNTVFFTLTPGVHTLYFLGKKIGNEPNAPDAVVQSSTITIVCTDSGAF